MKFLFKRKWYSKAFGPVLLCRSRFLVVFGGRGSGKTNHIILKYLAKTYSKEHVIIYYCRHEKTTLRGTTFKDICNYINASDFKNDFEFSEADNSSMVFTNKITGKQLLPFGLEDPEKTKGISEATDVWIDEADKCTQAQVAMISAVLRTPKAEYLQLIVSFNPVSEDSWLREFFFSEEDAYKPHPRFGDSITIHHSTVYDNEYIDVEAYVNNLQLMYGYSINLINVNIYGKWGVNQNDNPWFTAWDENRHVSKTIIEPYPNLPIFLSFDFNIDPMCAIVGQHSQVFNQNAWCHILKEYKIVNPKVKDGTIGISIVDHLCNKIKQDFPTNLIYATGDSNGRSRNAGYGNNDTAWAMIIRKLRLSPAQMKAPLANMSHKSSRFNNNYILYNFPRFLVNPTCKELINEISIAKPIKTEKQDREDELFKGPASGEYGMNLVDCFRYYNDTFIFPFVKKL